MRRLIALDLPGGPAFVDALRRAWDDGDAVVPVDGRLPETARRRLLDAVRPHAIVGPDGEPRPGHAGAPGVEDGDALVLATSGTTGHPKVIVHTHAGLRAHADAVHHHLAVDPDRDRWLACLPLAHIGGLGVVVRSLLTDVPVDVLDGFDADAVASAPTERGTTLVSLVATALDRVDPARFRWVVLGGSSDPVDRPSNVVRTYGLTETGGGIVYDGTPLSGVDLRIDDDGVIAVRGPMLARGRRTDDGRVEPVTDVDGWFRTGDLGSLHDEPDGGVLLSVDGRADDLIVTGGQNVWPEPVEAVIAEHPSVQEVAVFGRPDPEWGTAVTASIVLRPGATAPSTDDIRAHVRASLPAYAAPRTVEVVVALPRTALGKVRRRALADRDPAEGASNPPR